MAAKAPRVVLCSMSKARPPHQPPRLPQHRQRRLRHRPAVGATPWLAAMADMAQRLRDWDGLRALLAGNREAALRDADLTIRLADLAEEDRDLPRAVDLLERAWRATGDRPFLLERLIVLAARIGVTGRWDAEHARAFPDRADRLARRLRRQAGGGA